MKEMKKSYIFNKNFFQTNLKTLITKIIDVLDELKDNCAICYAYRWKKCIQF